MLPALLTMVGLAAAAGIAAAYAARRSNEYENLLIDQIDALLPQTQCGRCTFPGCRPYATAVASGTADINQCPPGGDATAAALAKLLGREPRPWIRGSATCRPIRSSHGSTKPRASAA